MPRFPLLAISNTKRKLPDKNTASFMLAQEITGVSRQYHNTSPLLLAECAEMWEVRGNFRSFYELDRDSMMRLPKTQSNTSNGPAIDP